MAIGLAQWLGPLLLVSLWGLSAPALLLRRLGEHMQRLQENSGLHLRLGPGTATLPRAGWLEQPLDPFNASDGRSFLQRYWVNDQHRAGQEGPVFLHLGGEGSLGPGSVMAGHPAALAPAFGALVISLEHRFYGLSVPPGGLGMAQLRYLSSRHALADVVSARLALSRLFNVSSISPWICFGGSYAGSLAAWTRLKVLGPLRWAGEGTKCGVQSRGAVQYDGQAGVPLSVRQLCGLLAGGGNRSHPAPYGGLRRAVQIVMHSLGQRCVSHSRAETVTQLRATEPQVSGLGDRQWLYQTCTELGFYVTCKGPGCPFSQLPALPSQLDLCEQVFGLSASSVAQAVAQTNAYYGGQSPGATQVLFVNGDTDPWHVLSVTQTLGPSEPALLIPSASHCLDMAPERPSDSPSLRLGRQSIFQQLQTWLRQAKQSQLQRGV
ncbi:thymus-specific serine protease [Marmota marmota marmota]|nr:thymus-specific serine protease [Marmota marmota marmota]